jgi:NADPH2:quinone reductase
VRAVTYSEHGPSSVLQLIEKVAADPGPGEVRVRLVRAGCNPADWKARAGLTPAPLLAQQVPGYDGAGVVDAVGDAVDPALAKRRVWVWEAAHGRAEGTAQEQLVLPATNVVPLPDAVSFDVGAALGIPFLTAHRCLTVHEGGPTALGPGTLDGRVVLVAGGAGAVGNAALQLARWSGATTVATVSGPEKGRLATAAGADHVIDYRSEDVAAALKAIAPRGVDTVVEVAPDVNAMLDAKVAAFHGTIAVYGSANATFPARIVFRNVRVQFVLVFTMSDDAKRQAVADVSRALADGAVRVGDTVGLPLHHFALDDVAGAHDAMECGAVGKVLIDLD